MERESTQRPIHMADPANSPARAEYPAARSAVPPGRLTRSQVARRLGVSVTTLRRMEGADLHPETGPRGVRLFDATEVEAAFVKIRTSHRETVEGADGETAAQVFTLLDDGLNPVEVVKRTRIGPDLVEHLQTQWVRLRRALVLPPDVRSRLETALFGEGCTGPGDWILKTAGDVESALSRAAEPTECAMCHKVAAMLCRSCAKVYVARSSAQRG
jgi:hypothetical protein